jgi:hypothetical protein
LIPPDPRELRYLVSTEAGRVDLTFPIPLPRARSTQLASVDVELDRPWSAEDQLIVGSSGRWEGARLSVDASSIGKTRLEGLGFSFGPASQLVDEDLWVMRSRVHATPTSTTSSLLELGLVRRISSAALSRPIAVQMRAQMHRRPATAWDLTAWQEDGVSLDRSTMVTRHFIRPDRASRGLWSSPCGGSARIVNASASTTALLGTLPEGDAAPEGYLTCAGLRGFSFVYTVGPTLGGIFLQTQACLCGAHPSTARLTLGPVLDLRLDGRPLGTFDTVYSAPFTLSWQAPAQGVATGYVVWLTWDILGAVVITDRTHVTLPAEFITPGVSIRPVITAVDDAARSPVESPFLRSATWQSSEWASGALRPER